MTIDVTGNYDFASGQTITTTDGTPDFLLGGSLTIDGTAQVTTSSSYGYVVAIQDGGGSNITIDASGSVTVNDTGANPVVAAYYSGSWSAGIVNNGAISVTTNGSARGLSVTDDTQGITNNGTLQVTAGADAYGVFVTYGQDGVYSNSGTITVSGVTSACGLSFSYAGQTPITNSGHITATASAGSSVGLAFGTGRADVINSGFITADTAINAGQANLRLTNTGTISGQIVAVSSLGLTDPIYGDQITNSGSIQGAIHIDNSAGGVYDGRGGTQTGGIYLGAGPYTVYLGNDGETVHGGSGAVLVVGGAGNDVADGGTSGASTFSYAGATSGVTVSLALQGSAQNTIGAGSDTLTNFQNLTGSAYADHLTGDANNNIIDGGGGNDTLDGGGGVNTVSFASAGSGVNVTLTLEGQAQATGVGSETLTNFQNLTGSAFNDTLEGDGNNSVLDGGGGVNTVSYAHAALGVTVSLALQGSAQNTIGAGTDTLYNFQNLTGSAFNDTLEGNAGNNVLDGGAGTNTVSYAHATAGVTVSLGLQGQAQNTVGAGTDTLSNFQALIGSAFNDTLEGGGYASTTLTGGLGADTFRYKSGDGAVTITDFSGVGGDGDVIDLSQLGSFTSFAQVQAAATQSGADTVITFGSGQSLTLKNVLATSLVAGDFVLPSLPFLVGAGATVTTSPTETLGITGASVTSEALVQFTSLSGGQFVNWGTLNDTAPMNSSAGVTTVASGPLAAAVFENYGLFNVSTALGMGVSFATTYNYGTFDVTGTVGATGATGDFVNYGSVNVQGAPTGTVYGVFDYGGLFQNLAGATFQVSSAYVGATSAVAVNLAAGGQFTNGGALTVSSATDAKDLTVTANVPTVILNSGTMTATGATSTGILVNTNSSSTSVSLQNSGTITAQTAFDFIGPVGTITNSGTLNGAVVFGGGTYQIVNTGEINGSVTLAAGAIDTLDSHLGTITGPITLGAGSINTVTLGAENDTVFLSSGTHVLDGGGGVNTLSYASANSGVTVSLAEVGVTQYTGIGADTLSNFQTLIGSNWNDTLTASNGTSTLTGGGGADTFIIPSGGANPTITDFSHAQGDKIDLSALTQFGTLSDVLAAAGQIGANTVIALGSGFLTLDNVQKSSLTSSDFVLNGAVGHGLTINISYDASANSAPAGFKTAVQAAVQFFESNFTGNATINISVGWGEVDGDPVTAAAQSYSPYDGGFTYSQVRSALAAAAANSPAAAAAIAALPLTDPTGGATFDIHTAEEKILGLLNPNAPGTDGWIGLNASAAYTFDPNNRAVPGEYDAIGMIEHEMSEVLGRTLHVGEVINGVQTQEPLDLFRYSLPGVHDFQPGSAFFSLDGTTPLKYFNNGAINDGDDGDWAGGSQVDAFDAFATIGAEADVSPTDASVMNVLGYGIAPSSAFNPNPTYPNGSVQLAPVGGGTLNGGPASDWLQGQGGNDTLHGAGGSDHLDGGGGLNTALYDGAYRQYVVGAGGATVGGGPESASDTLVNIQRIQFVDGYLATSPTDTAGQVYRLYEAALGRLPDPVGLAGWTHALNSGTSLQAVAAGFVNSQEFQNTYGALDNTHFITLLYANVLHRLPDPGGLTGWLGYMAQGHTQADVLLGFSQSQEDINDSSAAIGQGLWIGDQNAAEVARLYDTVLNRLPDIGGLTGWTKALDQGTVTLIQVAQDFAASAEFQNVYGSLDDTDFVTQLYENTLHRLPDPGGLAGWLGALAQGVSRAQVVLGFSDSQEHINDTAPHINNGIWLA